MKWLLTSFIIFLALQVVFPQTQVTSFQTQQSENSSNPSDFIRFKNKVFFEAENSSYGREIWVSDGNPNGAVLLKDIFPGNQNGIITSFAKSSVVLNDILYFVATDGTSEGEIWKTDGTREGTKRVSIFLDFAIQRLTVINDYFYLSIKRGNALQVWRSNGGSPVKVKDEIPGWSLPSFETELNGLYVFTFQPEGSNHSAIWRSDGTEAGTYVLLSDIEGNGAGEKGMGPIIPSHYIEYHNELYFFSRHFLHKTDGFTVVDIKQINDPNLYSIHYGSVILVNDHMYFSFFNIESFRLSLWESDGTFAGTKSIYDIARNKYFLSSNLSSWGNKLVFLGPDQVGGSSLMTMDLDDFEVHEIKQIPDPTFAPFSMIACTIKHNSNGLFFISVLKNYGEPAGWVSQLTNLSTKLIPALQGVRDVFVFNDLFYFAMPTEINGSEFGRSDGTEENTMMLNM